MMFEMIKITFITAMQERIQAGCKMLDIAKDFTRANKAQIVELKDIAVEAFTKASKIKWDKVDETTAQLKETFMSSAKIMEDVGKVLSMVDNTAAAAKFKAIKEELSAARNAYYEAKATDAPASRLEELKEAMEAAEIACFNKQFTEALNIL